MILSSPFEAFKAYEREAGLPKDFIRMLNARNPDTNAWAKMERSEVSLEDFVGLFEAEAAAAGARGESSTGRCASTSSGRSYPRPRSQARQTGAGSGMSRTAR